MPSRAASASSAAASPIRSRATICEGPQVNEFESARICRRPSRSSIPSGSPCRTASAWRRASGCRALREELRCPPCWNTSPIAGATARPSATCRAIAYFAGHGYAAVRVDMRGSGDSDGLLADEYLAQEHDDALDVIAWLARQPWCNGKVGMMGISWGGFNALQVAARRPPALKADHRRPRHRRPLCRRLHYMGGGAAARQSLLGLHHAGL